MADVKICGIRTYDDLSAVHQAGARWVGFVFFQKSPRHLAFDEARALRTHLDALSNPPLPVALTVDADDALLDLVVEAAQPTMIQCHGKETPARVLAIKDKYSVNVMKAIRVAHVEALKVAEEYDGVADMILFDSAPDSTGLPGGTGQRFDWRLMQSYEGKTPWMLAGGLTPENVAEAILTSGAKAVDVSSGVDKSPGQKDFDAIHRFVSAAR